MTTVREAVYMVLDELKLISDDAHFTEEHVIFLLKKFRAYVLKAEKERNKLMDGQDLILQKRIIRISLLKCRLWQLCRDSQAKVNTSRVSGRFRS